VRHFMERRHEELDVGALPRRDKATVHGGCDRKPMTKETASAL
jgi:hypothetical protein